MVDLKILKLLNHSMENSMGVCEVLTAANPVPRSVTIDSSDIGDVFPGTQGIVAWGTWLGNSRYDVLYYMYRM